MTIASEICHAPIALVTLVDEKETCRAADFLAKALDRVKALSDVVPICSYCRRIRDDQQYWQRVEVYLRDHAGTDATVGICPSYATTRFADEPLP